MPREFMYRGHTMQQLEKMSMDEIITLLPSRQRRSLGQRGPTPQQTSLLTRVRNARKQIEKGQEPKPIKTHARDAVILPEMVGLTIHVHSGKEFIPVEIKPQMIGQRVGEYAITNRRVVHGKAGVGATRSSMYVPLK